MSVCSPFIKGFLDWPMPIEDVNKFVELLLLAMGRTVFPMNRLRDVFESVLQVQPRHAVHLFLSLLFATAART